MNRVRNKELTMSIFPEHCSGLNNLYNYARSSGLLETGSSSIDPSLAASCSEVRSLMGTTCGVKQIHEQANELWAALGDPSGILYFGGRMNGRRISTAEYLELLALVFDQLSDKASVDVEKIAATFFQITQISPEDCRPIDLDI
jgi:hypothetical protein